ncbi:MAG: hypothetical protein JXX29_17920 [Deltaproteobacteria bacterium]|nr:hypothetical protein [Deltaproteobacteria bacterium]MBN2673564.1 hypothetical protein [Deltaproteobacteria bacterium]
MKKKSDWQRRIQSARTKLFFVLAAAVCISTWALGCSPVVFQLNTPVGADTLDALETEAQRYYGSKDADDMKAAVVAAGKLAPNSAIYHELAADLAYLNGEKDERFKHLVAALQCPENDVAILHVHELYEMAWTFDQTVEVENLLEFLMENHPDSRVTALARHYFSLLIHQRGRIDEANEVRKKIGWPIPFAAIGTWDNSQGKGFDVSYPPEDEIDLKASYPGQTVDVKWRTDLVIGQQGELDLAQQMYPNSSAVAYLASAFKVSKAGDYELRLTTTDGIKIWVNGQMIFNERRIGSWNYDTLTIPVHFEKGVNNILIKTAQDGSGWDLFARITKAGGEPVSPGTLEVVPADTKVTKYKTGEELVDVTEVVESYVSKLRVGSARKEYFAISYAARLGLEVYRAKLAEEMMDTHPESLRGKLELIFSLWDNQERGRTTDLLAELVEEAGDDFVIIMLKQIRLWQQNDLDKNAREATFALKDKYPDNPAVWLALVQLYSAEGWIEDKCHTVEEMDRKFPGWVTIQYSLAECFGSMDYPIHQRRIYEGLLEEFPYDYGLMNNMVSYALGAYDYDEAISWLERIIEAWPERGSLQSQLADLYRQLDQSEIATEMWKQVAKLNPDAPSSYYNIASLAYYEKDKKTAIEYWRKSLERNPDNGALAERLAYLAPKETEPWEQDVPSEAALAQVVANRDQVEYSDSADMALLYDHCVTDLQPDGSSINVTTTILHALNVSGRDAMTEFTVPCYGYSRILHAYAVSPDGRRSEPSSIRGKTIRFRQLEVGASIVVQNRCEQSADALIGDYFSYKWSFQSFNKQFVDSQFILWAPKSATLNEFLQGDVERTAQEAGPEIRYSWRAQNTPVLKAESSMPSTVDFAWYLEVSTVPDWSLFLKWEDSLLQDVFRVSPEVTALANQLAEGKTTVLEKLYAIHSYLVTDIRYQQDYENYVAGVKPHTAPQVIARGYGDCKDKSVLFITLAQLMGIEARFTLVRTRTYGQIIKEVPSQQFNHAIVYIPAQEGLENARFFDATADALDVDVIRSDDPGTWAMVLNRDDMSFEWIQIPYQTPEMNSGREKISMTIAEDGSAEGSLLLSFKGHLASIFRQTSRNPEKFQKIMQIVTDAIIKGAVIGDVTFEDIENIEKPVELNVAMKTDEYARVKDKELRFKIPFDAKPEKLFSLEKREHDLILGVPNHNQWESTFTLPKGSKVTHLPPVFEINTDCITFKREVTTEKETVFATQTLTYTCERIEAAKYPTYRKEIQKLRSAMEDDVVVKLK